MEQASELFVILKRSIVNFFDDTETAIFCSCLNLFPKHRFIYILASSQSKPPSFGGSSYTAAAYISLLSREKLYSKINGAASFVVEQKLSRMVMFVHVSLKLLRFSLFVLLVLIFHDTEYKTWSLNVADINTSLKTSHINSTSTLPSSFPTTHNKSISSQNVTLGEKLQNEASVIQQNVTDYDSTIEITQPNASRPSMHFVTNRRNGSLSKKNQNGISVPKTKTPPNHIIISVLILLALVLVLFPLYGFIRYKFKLNPYNPFYMEPRVSKYSWKVSLRDLQLPGTLAGRQQIQTTHTLSKARCGLFQSFAVIIKAVDMQHDLAYLNMRREIAQFRHSVSCENILTVHGVANLRHGLCGDTTVPRRVIVMEYCYRGALREVLNDGTFLEFEIQLGLMLDLANGLAFIQNSAYKCHGMLRTDNCFISASWALKIGFDFAILSLTEWEPDIITGAVKDEKTSDPFELLLWTAPEVLDLLRFRHWFNIKRLQAVVSSLRLKKPTLLQRADVYSMSIIMQEILEGSGPFPLSPEAQQISIHGFDRFSKSRTIITQVKMRNELFHPKTRWEIMPRELIPVLNLEQCWSFNPLARPDLSTIVSGFNVLKQAEEFKANQNLEACVVQIDERIKRRVAMMKQVENMPKLQIEKFVYSLMPKRIADEWMEESVSSPKRYLNVTLLFAEIAGLHKMLRNSDAKSVILLLNEIFSIFDQVLLPLQQAEKVYKVETIGEQYMMVSGLPNVQTESATIAANVGLELIDKARSFPIPSAMLPKNIKPNEKMCLPLKVGIHTGQVVAGIVGHTVPRYRVIGDTVNYASRIQAYSYPGIMHASLESTNQLKDKNMFTIQRRGIIDVKGKGKKETFWVTQLVSKPVHQHTKALMALAAQRDAQGMFRMGEIPYMNAETILQKDTGSKQKANMENMALAAMKQLDMFALAASYSSKPSNVSSNSTDYEFCKAVNKIPPEAKLETVFVQKKRLCSTPTLNSTNTKTASEKSSYKKIKAFKNGIVLKKK